MTQDRAYRIRFDGSDADRRALALQPPRQFDPEILSAFLLVLGRTSGWLLVASC
jgi:HD-GYP domain-containing protein (c-di-GMP phosphodiesterase class II)